uniref:vesicle-fusing ATPase n=1 Tax=Ciona intestinalis TaxID=7719 RepID=F6XJC0_CIOIN|nr:uncharacterized protein LOC100175291 [Ciona intestinalis]|eukprot:XP_002129249.1 uncharacterized protein LOC100175291 [Ciona intestinalis]
MGGCCCKWTRIILKDNSTQTVPLLEGEKAQTQKRNDLAKCRSSLETALHLVQRAVEEDRARNYVEALSLYQHALVYFLESLNYEAESENIKEKILSKCKQYLDRAEKLAEYLNAHGGSRGKRDSALSGTSTLKWTDDDVIPAQGSDARTRMSKLYNSIMRKNKDSNSNNNKSIQRSYSTR